MPQVATSSPESSRFRDLTGRLEPPRLRGLIGELFALHDLALELWKQTNESELAELVVERCVTSLGFDRVAIVLVEGDGVKVTRAHAGIGGECQTEKSTIEDLPFAKIAAAGVRERDMVHIDERAVLQFQGEEVEGWRVVISLWSGDRALGVLSCDNVIHNRPLERSQVKVLTMLGGFVSQTLAMREFSRSNRSDTDSLTGLPNREGLVEQVRLEWARLAREKGELALLLVDVDDFRRFDHALGHQVADAALCRVAQCLANNIFRPADLVGRYGRDQFAVLLPSTSEDGAEAIADRLRRAVSAMHIEHPDSGVGRYVTISLGVAVRPAGKGKPEEMFALTREALTTAKQEGKNRVIVAAT